MQSGLGKKKKLISIKSQSMGLERGGMAKGMEVGIGKEENVAIFRRYMCIDTIQRYLLEIASEGI